MIERQPLTFSGEDTESKRFVMIKTFESERVKEYTSSRGLKKNNGERDMGKIDEVRLGFETAYIDGNVASNTSYKLLFHNYIITSYTN